MLTKTRLPLTRLFAACVIPVTAFAADNWPQWRGSHSNGVAAGGAYPTTFSANDGVAWKADLPGLGMSTPAVWDDCIFVTCGIDGQDGVVAFDFAGQELWRKQLGPERPGKNRNASGSNPSPTADGEHVVVYFKSGLLACLDFQGELQWHRNLQTEYGADTLWWDLSTSPVLVADRVVIAVMQEGESFLAAFELGTGDVAWKVPRNYDRPRESDQAYTTPLVTTIDGRQALITFGADHLTAHDAATGALIWDDGSYNPNDEPMWRVIACPVISGDLLLAPFGRGSLLAAVKLEGQSPRKLWEVGGRGLSPEVPTPVVDGQTAYLLTDEGRVKCLDLRTGQERWHGDLPRSRHRFYASPVLAGGKLYCPREDGTIFVVAAGDKFEQLAENAMGEKLIASPAPVRGGLLIRGERRLFWIEPAARDGDQPAG